MANQRVENRSAAEREKEAQELEKEAIRQAAKIAILVHREALEELARH